MWSFCFAGNVTRIMTSGSNLKKPDAGGPASLPCPLVLQELILCVDLIKVSECTLQSMPYFNKPAILSP